MNDRWNDLAARFSGLRVLVIGEAILDSYVRGSSNRLAPEAPVPVVSVTETVNQPGGAANAAANLRSLGAGVTLLSVIGKDSEGEQLAQTLEAYGVSGKHLLRAEDRQTLLKRRIVAGSQLMVRYDQGSTGWISDECEAEMIQMLRRLLPEADLVVLSDYRYGILTPRVIEEIEMAAQKVPVFVDSKRPVNYRGLRAAAVKMNFQEAAELLQIQGEFQNSHRLPAAQAAGYRLLDLFRARTVVVTMDSDGALFFERPDRVYRTYAHRVDAGWVSGAGDTFTAALSLSLASGADAALAAEIASAASALVVEKEGTALATAGEVGAYLFGAEKRVDDLEEAARQAAEYHQQGRKVVFTNGVFDILHSGHVAYLNHAKEQGDILILGLNSDESVQRLKGPDRPINNLDERARVLSALSCIDLIVPFSDDTPVEVIRQVRPDIYVKGGDYSEDRLPEAPVVRELGGDVRILPFLDGRSTTNVIEKIRHLYSTDCDQG